MNLQLVFEHTGDCIDLTESNRELVDYYLESLNKTNKNKFILNNTDLVDRVKYLKKCITDIDNFFVTKLKNTALSKFLNIELYNQNNLNTLHREWVKLLIENKNIPTLLNKIDSKLLTQFNDINHLVHFLEHKKFRLKNFSTYEMWFCNNIFSNSVIDFNSYNISIEFNNLGRNTYNKWEIYDQNVLDNDTNDFSLLSGELILKTARPYTREAPNEYIEWCKRNSVPVIGNTIGLANFKQSVDQVQRILFRNIERESNTITIEV